MDLEFWWNNEFYLGYIPKEKNDYLVESLELLLNLFRNNNIKATFFVLGAVAEKYPDSIDDIYNDGHEIASHGYSHTRLHSLGKEKFEEEIKKSLDLLSPYDPIGFRAPSFSVDNSTRWVFGVLEQYGFKYDSSIFPIKTMLYGVPDAPVGIYRPSFENIIKNDPNGSIIEFPLSVLKFGFNFPLSGGFYLRVLPTYFLKKGLEHINSKRPSILYIHPHEVNDNIPKLKCTLFSHFICYYGRETTLKKMEILLQNFEFMPIRDVLYGI